MRLKGVLISLFLALPFVVWAESSNLPKGDSTMSLSGVVNFSSGEVMKGMYKALNTGGNINLINAPNDVAHCWFGNPLARLNIAFRPNSNLEVLLGFEGNIFLNTFPTEFKTIQSANGEEPPLPQLMDWRLHQAQGIFSLFKNEEASLSLALGLMPYKYNPEVRNLGEFLFRTGTYPFYEVNDFDFPEARVSGLRANFNYTADNFKLTLDQFVLTERNFPPLNDIALATLASLDIDKIITIGAGVDFAHLIALNDKITTPAGARFVNGIGANNDTTWGQYTYKGTKLMGRVTLDPFGNIRGEKGSAITDLLGECGGKIYGEVAVTGLKNYPLALDSIDQLHDTMNVWGYTKVSQRMPWMVGINIPTWKIFDVCSFEIEKYPAPYPNDYYQAFYGSQLPIPTWVTQFRTDTVLGPDAKGNPGIVINNYRAAVYSIQRWYWSLYMKRHIAGNAFLIGQVAHDHMRWDVNTGLENNYATEEIMPKPGQWTWRVALLMNF